MNSDPLKTAPALEATTQKNPPSISLDQKFFFGIVGTGVLLILIVTALAIGRSRREGALARELERSATALNTAARVPDRPLINFTLIDRTGRTVTRADLAGKFLVVNFVFTGCSISCLAVNHRMAEVQEAVSGQQDIHLVSLTVDPDSDSPERLAKFATQFGADTNRWLFLTGEKRMLHPLLEESFLVQRDQRLLGFVPGGFSHTDRIAVMDNHGRLRGLINGLKPTASRDVLELLAQLRAESPSR